MLHPKSVLNQTPIPLTLAYNRQELGEGGNASFHAKVTLDFPCGVSVLSGLTCLCSAGYCNRENYTAKDDCPEKIKL